MVSSVILCPNFRRWAPGAGAGLWLIGFLCFLAAAAHAASVADVDGDNGLPNAQLGAPLASFTGLRKTEDTGRWLTFDRPADKLDFLGIRLKGITYNFFKERLYTIDLELEGRGDVRGMLKALERRYGKNHSLETKTYKNTNAQLEVREWAGTKVYCLYKSAADSVGAELVFVDRPTWDALQIPREERAAQSRDMLKGSYTNGDF